MVSGINTEVFVEESNVFTLMNVNTVLFSNIDIKSILRKLKVLKQTPCQTIKDTMTPG